jgi:hypothetical protein
VTIVLEIGPEVEAELARRASLCGTPVETCAATLLEAAVYTPSTSAPAARNLVELFAPLRGLNWEFERDGDTGEKAGRDRVFLSVMTLVEICKGIDLLPVSQRRSGLQAGPC